MTVSPERPGRPLLRWHGGKYKLAPWIVSLFPEHRVYVEPYGGAGSVLLAKPRSYAEVYNDLDDEVVNLFRLVRDRGTELERRLRLIPFARREFEAAYEPSADEMERAVRLVVRCYMGFGTNAHHRVTGFRSNSSRAGTTPAHDWWHYPDHLGAMVDRLRGVVIESREAREVMEAHDGDATLHYLDPPYAPEVRDAGTDYACEMTADDHVALAAFARGLRGMVIVSGYDGEMYRELYRGWRVVRRRAYADGARPRTEAVWLSPNTPSQGDLFR